MIEIKWTAVADAIKAVKERNGLKVFGTIIGRMTAESREVFEGGTVLPLQWYPLDAFVQFLEMDLEVTAGGDEQELIRRSEELIERQLSGVYETFVKGKTPKSVLSGLSAIHQTYFRGVDVEIEFLAPGKAIVKYLGFAKQHRLIGLVIIGFYKKALQLCGAKGITIECKTPIEEGKGYFELSLGWLDS